MVVFLLNLIIAIDGHDLDHFERLEGSELYKTILLPILVFFPFVDLVLLIGSFLKLI